MATGRDLGNKAKPKAKQDRVIIAVLEEPTRFRGRVVVPERNRPEEA
jgi:hypothetical protein